jgi:hypothetical protein
MAALGFLMLILIFPIFLANLLLKLLPIGIILFLVFSIIGIFIFFIVEYFIKKYLEKLLQKILSDKMDIIKLVNRIIHLTFLIIKISISLFAYAVLVGFLALFKELTFNIYKPFLMIMFLQIFFIILLKIFKKNVKYLLNIIFLIEPYILILIFLGIQWVLE